MATGATIAPVTMATATMTGITIAAVPVGIATMTTITGTIATTAA